MYSKPIHYYPYLLVCTFSSFSYDTINGTVVTQVHATLWMWQYHFVAVVFWMTISSSSKYCDAHRIEAKCQTLAIFFKKQNTIKVIWPNWLMASLCMCPFPNNISFLRLSWILAKVFSLWLHLQFGINSLLWLNLLKL